MDAKKDLKRIIDSSKWVENDMGMGRKEYVKLLAADRGPVVFLCSDIIEKPLWSRIEEFLVIEGKIIVFYDGENSEELEKNEYKNFQGLIQRDEWEAIFESEPLSKLSDMGVLTSERNFCVELHEVRTDYKGEVDNETSLALNCCFGL